MIALDMLSSAKPPVVTRSFEALTADERMAAWRVRWQFDGRHRIDDERSAVVVSDGYTGSYENDDA